MNKDTIVQFVCFTSTLEVEEFTEIWAPYARLLVNDPSNVLLQEVISDKSENRFNYVSSHKCGALDFRFAFMKERSDPEHKTRIMQAGGYMPVQLQSAYKNVKDNARILAFVSHSEIELDFYSRQNFQYLDIYEAYFENCVYSYVMEFFLPKHEAPALLAGLKARPRVEARLYNTCRVAHSSRKASGSLL